MDEKILAKKAKNCDKEAFAKLYTLYKDKLYRYAFFKLKNEQDAMDAVSECICEAYRYIHSLKNLEAFSAWIFRILYRSCSHIIKEQVKSREQEEIDENTASYTEDFKKTELSEALAILGEEEKDIVLLSTVTGYNSKEIAKILGLKPNTVRSKLSRSLSKMREFLE
ncbi:MAG: sigma-70 family RNA polymerase sigma factor [Ruminococcus sp.]|nr:sigma-70 family RNA polymerase sigma factor [Ruminococcus sp.]